MEVGKMRKLIIGIVLRVAIAATEASNGQAWVSNTFTNPTRDLRCTYYANRSVVTCMRANDRKQMAVYGYRGRGFQVYDWPDARARSTMLPRTSRSARTLTCPRCETACNALLAALG
jgi:hypothetical protein